MDIFTAIFLGILQGFLEFLPISSSFHLTLLSEKLGIFHQPISPLFFLFVHLGTLGSCLWFLGKDFWEMLQKKVPLTFFMIALVPLAFGYILHQKTALYFSPTIGLQISGAFLLFTSSVPQNGSALPSKRSALFIGTFQALALFPGISRSGMTVSASFLRGWRSKEAVRISFLLAVPTILAGVFVETLQLGLEQTAVSAPFPQVLSQGFPQALLGMLASLIAGRIAISFIDHIFAKQNLRFIGLYLVLAPTLFPTFYALR
ncbi:MAG: undecaprenyl-diphosphate phosphatase [Chlamydiota bacterium]